MPGVARRTRASAPGHVRGIDWSHPLAQGLVFAAPFGEPRLRDAVSNRRLTLTGTVESSSDRGAAMLSTGGTATGGFETPNANLLNPTHVTLAASIQWVTLTAAPQKQLFGKPYTSFAPPYYQYVFTQGANSRFSVAAGGIWRYAEVVTATYFQAGPWYRLVGTYDGADVRFYINGEQAASTSATGAISAYSTPLSFGYAVAAQPGVNAYFQDCRVYNRALLADEVREDYRDQWAIYDQGARTYFIPAAAGGGPATFDSGIYYRTLLSGGHL